jgi:hypothetical protein
MDRAAGLPGRTSESEGEAKISDGEVLGIASHPDSNPPGLSQSDNPIDAGQ